MAATDTTSGRGPAAGLLDSGEGAAEAVPDVDTLLAEVDVPGLDRSGSGPSIRSVLATHGATPLLVLTALNTVDELDRIAMVTLAPDIQETFGLSSAAIGAISGLSGMVVVGGSVVLGALGDRRRRVPIVGLTALLWALFAGLTGLVRSGFQLTLTRLLSGVGKGSIEPVHTSLLADYYPVETRGRVLGFHRTANPLAGVLGPALVGGIAALAGGAAGWRWAFILTVPLTVLPALAAFTLREPPRGQFEDPEAAEARNDRATVPLATSMRRLLEIRSLRHMYFGIGVLGFGLVGAPVIMSLYLEEFWGLEELGRGVFFSVGAIGPLLGIPLGGAIGDRLFRRHPAWPLHLLAYVVPAWAVVIVGSLYLPTVWLVAAGWVLGGAVLGLATPAFLQLVAATAPPAFRGLAFSLFGVYLYVLGGFFGPLLMGAAADAWDERAALTLLVIPAVISGVLLVRGARFVAGDIQMVIDDLGAEADARRRRLDPTEDGTNIVELRGIDFSYGQTQVLFGVDLDVPRGEILALLGTNGAGKSTVLRVLTGLAHPQRGQIRLDGLETTYLEAEQVLDLGVAQMPGGKAVFPSMTVEENLEVATFSFRKERARIEADLERVHTWFPFLHERRHQLASTLSGGEQQMLGLAKAFLTRPRLLCIDELSLGLAPSITADLLDIVREIHANGTTIVIVEQSVNVALALATTAVFMEKGEVRFAGPAQELSDRGDLLRSVFLEGAGGNG